MKLKPTTLRTVAQSPEILPRLLTVQDAAKYLGATVWAVRRLFLRGEVPTIKIGKRHNVAREDLDRLIDLKRQLYFEKARAEKLKK